MARHARFAPTGSVFHVVNRGVERRRLFYQPSDYQRFIELLKEGKERYAVQVLGICVMPNHYHVMMRPTEDRALSAYLHWVQGCYASDLRWSTQSKGYGHVFQQRFWSGPIFDDQHFVTALRYVEGNPVAADLVKSADTWRWNSLVIRRRRRDCLLDPLPIELPTNWLQIVNAGFLPDEGF